MARSSCFTSSLTAALYEILNGFFRYSLVRTSQSFQSLIRMRICLPAQNRLDGFGHDRPTVVQIGIDGSRSSNNLRKPFSVLWMAITMCPIGTPTLRKTVESVKSRCKRDTGNFILKCANMALAIPNYLRYSRNLSGSPYEAWHWNRPRRL